MISAAEQEEIVTGTLSRNEVLCQVAKAGQLLQNAGIDKIRVEYGWGCNLDTDDLWQGAAIDLTGLAEFVGEAERKGIYRAGAADLFVGGVTFQLFLCHEADIHFRSSDSALLHKMKELWESQGITVVKRMGTGEWTPP